MEKKLVSLTNGQKLNKKGENQMKSLLFDLCDTSCINLIKRKDVIAKSWNIAPGVSANIMTT